MNHIDILNSGVLTWNKWREENPGVRPDLRGAYLGGAHLEGANLRGADLRGANLRGANLAGVCLIDAGQDGRGYRFIGVPQVGKSVRILAGCRWLSLNEARTHWADNADALRRVELIAETHKEQS